MSLTAVRRVVVPVDDERFRFDSDEVPHGARLWTNVLALMATHAWLEQRNREVIELANGEQAVMVTTDEELNTDYLREFIEFCRAGGFSIA